MAISPREELRIESLVVFAKFDDGWVWAERTPDGATELDSGERYFNKLAFAVEDFFNDRGVDVFVRVEDPSEAHYSSLIRVSDDEYHIRKYAYGAPDPFQMVAHV
jgi:hypothetical protein